LFPTGYDVSDDAPSTFRGLCKHLDSGGRMTVYRGGSEATIFADNEVNYAFRAFLDSFLRDPAGTLATPNL
jgi:hypothetical protein